MVMKTYLEAYRQRRLARKVQSLVPPPDGDDMDRQNATTLIRVISAQHARLCSQHGASRDVDRAIISAEARLMLQQALTAYQLKVIMRPRNGTSPAFAEFYRTAEKVIQSIDRDCP
jgi:hypothetical protein